MRSNADLVAAALRKDAQATVRVVDQVLERGAIAMVNGARARAPKARSTLTDSIKQQRLDVARFEVYAGASYAVHVEEGAGPGGWVPRASLANWMQAAKVTPRDPRMSADSLTRLLQLLIYRNGTPAQPFFRPAVEAEVPAIDKLLADRLQKVIGRSTA